MRSLLFLFILVACGSKPPETPVGTTLPNAEAPTYKYDSLDERPVGSEALHGKLSVVAFVQIDNLLCQAQVGYLVAMAKNDGAIVNYALVAVDEARELVEFFRDTMKVTFPVAVGDAAVRTGATPFGPVEFFPAVFVVDENGKLVWKKVGLAKSDELRAHMPAAHPPSP